MSSLLSRLGSARVPEVSVSLSVMMIFSFVCCMFLLPLWPAYVEAKSAAIGSGYGGHLFAERSEALGLSLLVA